MKYIFGLGNPGSKYDGTRHNMGYMAVDILAQRHGIMLNSEKHKGLVGRGMIGSTRVMLIKPLTYMNSSGECVKAVMDYYNVPAEDIIVIYDDIDLAPGQLRIRLQGAAGSHNGMKSIIGSIGTELFPRIRVGVGDRPREQDLIPWVLGRPSGEDAEVIRAELEDAATAAEMMAEGRINDAQTEFNKKK